MNAPVNTQVNELQVIDQKEIALAFNNDQGIQAIIDNIKAQVNEKFEGVVWDFSKKKDRDTVASLAYKVGRSKTAIDAEGKKLKEQYTVFTKKIDAERKLAREQLEAEQARIRKPLDEWEEARKAHIQAIKDRISAFDSGRVDAFSSSDLIKQVISEVEAIAIDESFEDFANEAAIKKDAALNSFKKSLEEALKREAERAELERLRQAEILRQQQEREAQIAREAAEKATREAEEKARFEAERVQREKTEAEQREARLVAEKEAAELRAQHAAEAERKRIEAEQAAKIEAERKAEEARQANQAHRKKICNEALKGLVALGIDEAKGKEILQAINKGLVPHVSIKF
ncbi:hypothetical protein NCY62_13940 [Acinetobacter pittii]|uniref:hypothetical protein n=1 Tax=Acinetobacter pittii TaxID=48296 RepID=UPI00202E0B7B|nr:hypothetical protein [Acinetobacter pittii]MCM1963202.1 hypothetical protein [Acinetobacter pittii]MCM1979601.1 hypothetical protein [Acinetobacter pittii]